MTSLVTFPQQASPLVGPDGRVTSPWLLFFQTLFNRTGGTVGDNTADLSQQATLLGLMDGDVKPTNQIDGHLIPSFLGMEQPSQTMTPLGLAMLATPSPDGAGARSFKAQTLTPSGSPYTATASSSGIYLVSGGTVSAITISRDGTTFLATGVTSGIIPARKFDQVRVAYTAAPTMNFLPM